LYSKVLKSDQGFYTVWPLRSWLCWCREMQIFCKAMVTHCKFLQERIGLCTMWITTVLVQCWSSCSRFEYDTHTYNIW